MLLIPVVCKRTFYAPSLLCLALTMERVFFTGLLKKNFLDPPPPVPLLCRLPGFRCAKACIIFHQLSVLISTKAAAMEQPLRLFVGLNFTDVRLLSFPRLNAAQRGWICKTNAAECVWGSQVAQKGRFSKHRDGESQHYTHVKSIKNKSAHEENTEFMVKELYFSLSYQTRNCAIFKQ